MDQIRDFLKVKRNLVGLIIFLILLIALPIIFYLARTTQIFKPRAQQDQIISRPTVVTIQTTRGIISSLPPGSLTLQSDKNITTFSLANTRDYQRIISGTIEADNVVATSAARLDLQVDQEVLVIWDKSATQSAKAIYIIR